MKPAPVPLQPKPDIEIKEEFPPRERLSSGDDAFGAGSSLNAFDLFGSLGSKSGGCICFFKTPQMKPAPVPLQPKPDIEIKEEFPPRERLPSLSVP
jgi:hypothetical protein